MSQRPSKWADQLYQNEQRDRNIYSLLPDQFTEYENEIYDPLRFYTSSGAFNLAQFNKNIICVFLEITSFYYTTID